MSRVVNTNRDFLQLLADCPAYQSYTMYSWDTFRSTKKVIKRILLPYKDTLLDLASPNVPYKTKKRVLVQEGSGFIEDVLAPVVSSLGFLML